MSKNEETYTDGEPLIENSTPAEYSSTDVHADMDLQLEDVYDIIGVGKTQLFYVVALSFVIYFDSAEMVAISTIVPILQCHWNLNVAWATAINVSSYGFSALGGYLFGKLPDVYGRKTVVSYAMVALFVSSTLSALAQEAWQFVILRCIVGLSMGVTFPTCVVYGAEIIKSKYRELGPLVATLVSNISVFGVSLSAYFLLNRIGWRWFIVFNSVPVIICFILIRLVPESPRYLFVSKRDKEAKQALRTMAKWNDKKLPENFTLQELEKETIGSYLTLLSEQYRKDIIVLSIFGFSNLIVIFGIIVFLPLALYSDFCGGNAQPPSQSCVVIDQSSLKDLSIVTSSGIFASVVGLISAVYLGRKLSWRIASIFGLLSAVLLIKCFSITFTKVVLFLLKSSFICLNLVFIILIPETFPTTIRNTAFSVSNSTAKLGGAIGCGFVYVLFYANPRYVVGMFAAAAVVTVVCSCIWQKETRNYRIVDTSSHQMKQLNNTDLT